MTREQWHLRRASYEADSARSQDEAAAEMLDARRSLGRAPEVSDVLEVVWDGRRCWVACVEALLYALDTACPTGRGGDR